MIKVHAIFGEFDTNICLRQNQKYVLSFIVFLEKAHEQFQNMTAPGLRKVICFQINILTFRSPLFKLIN